MFAWTPERKDFITARWRAGFSASQIAAAIELLEGEVSPSRNAVIGVLHRLRETRPGAPVRGIRQRRSPWAKAQKRNYSEVTHRMRKSVEVPLRAIDKTQRLTGAAQKSRERTLLNLPQTEPGPIERMKTEIPEPISKRLTIEQLTPHMCRYIADKEPPWTYCAHDALPDSSWCEFHAAICLQKVSVKEADRLAARAANWR